MTQILDHRTLEVTFQGATMRIHIRPVDDTSKEDLAALALHQDVIGNIRNIDADGLPIADVALRNGENLREALRQHQRQKPEVHARDKRKREEEVRLRHQAAEADSNQRAAAPFEGRVVKVLDGQTLQVLRQGNPVTVRVRDIPTHVSKDRIHELVGQQVVTVIVYSRTPGGIFVGEVILPTGHSLSQEAAPANVAAKPADVAAKYDKPPVPTVGRVPASPAQQPAQVLVELRLTPKEAAFCEVFVKSHEIIIQWRDAGKTKAAVVASFDQLESKGIPHDEAEVVRQRLTLFATQAYNVPSLTQRQVRIMKQAECEGAVAALLR